MDATERSTAKRVIESLRNSGQPPKLGASALNVGTTNLLETISGQYLQDHCASIDGMDGGGACKWIEADYGNGKTQFLRCVQELGWSFGFVVAYVELSQDESPLDRPDRVYSAVARSVQAQPSSPADVDRTRGLDAALSQLLDRKFKGVLSGEPHEENRRAALAWVQQSFRVTPIESSALMTAATIFLSSRLKGDTEREELARLYLRGEPIPQPELRAIGIYEKLDQTSGFRLLRSLTQLLQRTELSTGTILLFDEARRTLSLMSTKSQKKACENLLSVINHCNSGDFPGTLFLYAVMPEFFTSFVTAYPALQQRCGPATRINLNALQGIKEVELLRQMAAKIVEIYCLAYQADFGDIRKVKAGLDLVAKSSLQEAMGTGSRRLLVRTSVQLLDQFRENGVQVLTASAATELVKGSREELTATESALVDSQGE